MKTLKTLLVHRACEQKTFSCARIALHLLALATGHEGLGRALAGICREFSR